MLSESLVSLILRELSDANRYHWVDRGLLMSVSTLLVRPKWKTLS